MKVLRRVARGLLPAAAAAAMLLAASCGGPEEGDGGKPGGGGGSKAPSTRPRVARGNWAGFRGAGGLGVSTAEAPPVRNDVVWKVPVDMNGKSSPVVWGRRVFLTGATSERREVICFDADTGERLWRKSLENVPGGSDEVPHIEDDTTYAAPTPVTDGKRLYATFANGDVGALDFDGKVLWSRALGLPENEFGHASSLALHDGLVLVQFDTDDESAMYGLDAGTGEVKWRTPRDVDASWPSPVVIETPKGPQVVTNSNEAVVAYDPRDGRELWRVVANGEMVAPSPTYAGGLVIAPVTADWVYAIRPDGSGDVTKTHVAWEFSDTIPDTVSPAAGDRCVFLVNDLGIVTCVDTATGKALWEVELETAIYSSPIRAGDLLYTIDRDGRVRIGRVDREKYEPVAQFSLGEPVDTTPAFVKGRMYIRGEDHLLCIGQR